MPGQGRGFLKGVKERKGRGALLAEGSKRSRSEWHQGRARERAGESRSRAIATKCHAGAGSAGAGVALL